VACVATLSRTAVIDVGIEVGDTRGLPCVSQDLDLVQAGCYDDFRQIAHLHPLSSGPLRVATAWAAAVARTLSDCHPTSWGSHNVPGWPKQARQGQSTRPVSTAISDLTMPIIFSCQSCEFGK
jgi:hypothetical protein